MAAPASRVRVLVADDHPIYREGIVRAVKERPDLELVAEAAEGNEATTTSAISHGRTKTRFEVM